MIDARFLTITTEKGLYIVLDGDDVTMDEAEGNPFIAQHGLSIDEFVRSLSARICYQYGRRGGVFRGSVMNTVMPLVAEDRWEQSSSGGLRTWRGNEFGYEFFPYTLADVQTVMRCGVPNVTALSERGSLFASHVIDGEGVAFLSKSLDANSIYAVLDSTGIPVERDVVGLLAYIRADGAFMY